MPTTYRVEEGDCLASIALRHGFTPEALWEHPDNASLRERRRDSRELCPGDAVAIPGRRRREAEGATERRHRFVRKGSTERLRLRLLGDLDEPLADVPYRLEVDGASREGRTGGDGEIEEVIPADAREARLQLGEDPGFEVPLSLGALACANEVRGLQQRLRNLGFDPGPDDGIPGPLTAGATELFQAAYDLEISGKLDETTREKLVEVYGS